MTVMDIRSAQDEGSARAGRGVRLLTVPGIAGIGYLASWVAGLSVPAPSPKFGATGTQIVSAFAGHQGAGALAFTLTEGLPAAGLAVMTVTLARAVRTGGRKAAGRVAMISGGLAAASSLAQGVAGNLLARTTSPSVAHALYQVVNRGDGIKMLALAVLAVTVAASAAIPRWLRVTGALLGASIAVSGVVYLLLVQSLSITAAAPALILLLVFIAGSGLVLGGTRRPEAARQGSGR